MFEWFAVNGLALVAMVALFLTFATIVFVADMIFIAGVHLACRFNPGGKKMRKFLMVAMAMIVATSAGCAHTNITGLDLGGSSSLSIRNASSVDVLVDYSGRDFIVRSGEKVVRRGTPGRRYPVAIMPHDASADISNRPVTRSWNPREGTSEIWVIYERSGRLQIDVAR